MARGRKPSFGVIPGNGIAIRGLNAVNNHLEDVADFINNPSNPGRRAVMSRLLEHGASYARSLVEPGENVEIVVAEGSAKNTARGSGGGSTSGSGFTTGGGSVIATGNDILFWEFGTGVTYSPGSHPKAAELGVEPASFSATHAGWLVGDKLEKFKGRWPYAGRWIMGQPPRQAMWDAAKSMREELPNLVAQITVFRK